MCPLSRTRHRISNGGIANALQADGRDYGVAGCWAPRGPNFHTEGLGDEKALDGLALPLGDGEEWLDEDDVVGELVDLRLEG